MSARTLLAVAVLAGALPGLAGAQGRQCTAPCIQAADSAYEECAASANGAFLLALDACVERDPVCVGSCRWTRRDCRSATGIAADVARCQEELADARQRCRKRFPLGSRRWSRCLDKAQIASARCQHMARRRHRRAFVACGKDFRECARACGVGAPREGVAACRADAKSTARALRADCKEVFEVTASGCIDKDAACVQQCGDARLICAAPTQSTLAQAIALCTTDVAAALAACATANPDGGTALEACVEAVQASGTACVDAAAEAAAPGIKACIPPYATCVAGCPDA